MKTGIATFMVTFAAQLIFSCFVAIKICKTCKNIVLCHGVKFFGKH